MRPNYIVDGKQYLFYTDYGQKWHRGHLHRMFQGYKGTAGIKKRGGLHVFSRHNVANIMGKRGCDISIVQEILRHKNIAVIEYTHIYDQVTRKMYDKYIVI
jgi:site-specific recombinase XerD